MSLSILITIIGLLLDIAGAFFLAKGVFFEEVDSVVDKAGIKNRKVERYNIYGTYKIINRCQELFYTRFGVSILVLGFISQIIGQLVGDTKASCCLINITLSVTVLFLIIAYLVVRFYDEKLKQDTVINFIERICQHNHDLQGYIINPTGMNHKDVTKKIANEFLKRKLSFNKFDSDFSINEKNSYTWLMEEIRYRYLKNENTIKKDNSHV